MHLDLHERKEMCIRVHSEFSPSKDLKKSQVMTNIKISFFEFEVEVVSAILKSII